MTTGHSRRVSAGPVRGLSPDMAHADVSLCQILRNSFSTGAGA